jgi:hypothetical protein
MMNVASYVSETYISHFLVLDIYSIVGILMTGLIAMRWYSSGI